MDRRHAWGKIAHDLLRGPVGILRCLGKADDISETADCVVAPGAGILIGKFLRRHAHGYPELRLVEVPRLQRKLETARHHADDRVRFAIENDDRAEDIRIAVITVQPQGIADDSGRLAGILLLCGEDAAEHGCNAECGKDAGGEPAGADLLRSCAAGELVVGGRVPTKGGEGPGCARVGFDLTGSDPNFQAGSQVISQQNEAVGIPERKRPQQDTFDQREDRGGCADTEGQGEDHGQGEAGCLAQLATGGAEILCQCVHASS